MILTLALLAQFFFGEYYGEPSGCNWCCVENESPPLELPLCNQGGLPQYQDWPMIRLEPQTGYGFSAPKIGFDYIVSGPFHHVLRYQNIDWNVRVFIGLEEAARVFPASVTGTVPVTMWVHPDVQLDMTLLHGNYSHVVHVPDEPALIGLTIYHQTVMWWVSPSGILRVVASRGVKTTIEE